ncbi:MAG: RNA methyltransferase [Planctomycetia bacterium]|nr:RNA methyltransferase [Planctomycetia bacterium]
MAEPTITSVHNPRVKRAIALRDGRQRRKQGLFLIDGVREIARALEGGVEFAEAFCCDELCVDDAARALVRRIERRLRPVPVVPAVMEKLAYGERCEGIVAVAKSPQRTLDQLPVGADSIVAVVAGVEKPGNVGAILRSADGAGISAVIAAGAGTDLYNPNTIRASLGAIFTLPVCAAGEEETRDWLRAKGFRALAARVEGGIDYRHADYRRPLAIVLGSEAAGLSALWSAGVPPLGGANEDVTCVTLPMRGRGDSLNVSAAAAVLFYEATRSLESRL